MHQWYWNSSHAPFFPLRYLYQLPKPLWLALEREIGLQRILFVVVLTTRKIFLSVITTFLFCSSSYAEKTSTVIYIFWEMVFTRSIDYLFFVTNRTSKHFAVTFKRYLQISTTAMSMTFSPMYMYRTKFAYYRNVFLCLTGMHKLYKVWKDLSI